MPKVMKPPAAYNPDNTVTGGDWYDGPQPTAGFYKGVVKKLLLQKANNGELHLMALCEISEGKFKGAGVVKWLQLTEQGSPWLNQFLMSLTDGSPAQRKGICQAFADPGFAVDEKDDKGRLPIVRIGKKFNPIGKPTAFMVKVRVIEKGARTGESVSEISRFVIPKEDTENSEPETSAPEDVLDDDATLDDSLSADDSAGLDEFDAETTSNPEPDAESDGDDPWSL